MPYRVVPAPAVLTWNLFQLADSLPQGEDAHTQIKFGLQTPPPTRKNGVISFAGGTVTVAPIVRVLKTANQTADLLSHEQGHFNIGILVGRAMAKELEGLSNTDLAKLKKAIDDVLDKHRLTLMPVVQKAYDRETEHSQNGSGQVRWDAMISAALGSPTPVSTLNSIPL